MQVISRAVGAPRSLHSTVISRWASEIFTHVRSILNQDEFSSNLTPPIPYNWGNTASQIRVGREMHFSNAGWSCNDCRLPGGCGWEICPPCAVHNSCSGLPLRSLPSGSVLIVTQKPRLGTHGQPHCADVPDWHDRRGSPFFYDHGPPFSWCFW